MTCKAPNRFWLYVMVIFIFLMVWDMSVDLTKLIRRLDQAGVCVNGR
jgi:hypothetical protein